jgi:Protein of unknown function (DUF2946)
MRRRLRKFLPIVLMALTVQIFAPIAACWAASIAASDPLQVAFICHDDGGTNSGQTDPGDQPRVRDGCCSVCSLAHSAAPVASPQTAVATPYGRSYRVVWRDAAPDLFGSRTGSHAQARAPPSIS